MMELSLLIERYDEGCLTADKYIAIEETLEAPKDCEPEIVARMIEEQNLNKSRSSNEESESETETKTESRISRLKLE